MTKRLLYLNGLAIMMIPLQHATAYGLQAMFIFMWRSVDPTAEIPNYTLLGSLPYHIITVIRQISTFSVPSFLFISGFFISFFARGKDAQVTWGQVLPRIKVLLYPFVIWTTLRFVMLRTYPKSIEDILQPYHFVPLLIQFYLISPWLVKMAKERWKLLLVLAATLHLGIQFYRYTADLGIAVPGQMLVLQLTPRWLFYGQQPFWFPLGIVFGLHTKEFHAKIVKAKWKLLAAGLVFTGLMIAEYYIAFNINGESWQGMEFAGSNFSGMIRSFFILSTILFVLSLDEATLPFPKLVTDLGSKSLGIYLANIPAIYVFALFMFHFTPTLVGNQLIYLSVLVAAGFGVPLLLMYIVRNSPLRSLYRYLFG